MSQEGKNQTLDASGIESLRLILERQQRRPVTYEEALEVGESLISFFMVLADGADGILHPQTKTVAVAA